MLVIGPGTWPAQLGGGTNFGAMAIVARNAGTSLKRDASPVVCFALGGVTPHAGPPGPSTDTSLVARVAARLS